MKPTQMSLLLLVIAELDKDDVGWSLPPGLPRALRALASKASEQLGRASLSARAGSRRPQLGSIIVLAAVPPTCHKQRVREVSSGQPRSIGEGCRAGRSPLTWETEAARNFHHLPEIHSERPVFDLRHGLDHPETGSHTDPQTAPERG